MVFDVIEQEWRSATAVARTYNIGRLESGAVSQLMCRVHPDVLHRITEDVKRRGMARFLTHDTIARGVFSRAFTSGVGAAESWADQLVNGDDNKLVTP